MKRLLVYRPAAERQLRRMDRSEAARVIGKLEAFAATGHGDVRALKGALKGRYALRVGKWRAFCRLDQPGTVLVIDLDNCGQAY